MKLICEVTEEVKYTQEILDEATGAKAYYIEGIFMEGDIKNRNGRMYPSEILAKEVKRYNEAYVAKNRSYGELGHPDGPSINLDRVSHMITSLKQEGSNITGRAKILDTPMGRIVKNLMDEGGCLGVSSRGMGSLKENRQGIMEVQSDFMLATAGDIVADPSAPNAFVRGIMEGVDWVFDVASGNWMAEQKLDQIRNSARKMTTAELQEHKVSMFTSFLKTL